MSNSLPRHDNPRDLVVNRAMRRSPEASIARSRFSVRKLLVVVVAAAGLSIVPVGMANALPTAATFAGSTCRVGDQDYGQAAVVNLNNGEYVCENGVLVREGSSDPYDGYGVEVPPLR